MLRTDFGPAASATHIAETAFATSSASVSASNTADTLTIPIVFGAIGAVLTLATIVIGIIQIRAARCRHRDAEAGQSDHELEEQQPRRDFAGTMMPPPMSVQFYTGNSSTSCRSNADCRPFQSRRVPRETSVSSEHPLTHFNHHNSNNIVMLDEDDVQHA
jgi:hypothetical protein